jgi:hypothetical protein
MKKNIWFVNFNFQLALAVFCCLNFNDSMAQMPAGYKGKPFDLALFMSNYYFKLLEKETPPSQFTASKVVWDAKMPVGSGWPIDNSGYASMNRTMESIKFWMELGLTTGGSN